MKQIGLHIWIRETRNYKPLIRDSIEKGYRIRLPSGASSFSGGWREPIEACAYRYCRMYGLDRFSDWYDVCRRLCDMWSGTPDRTLDSVVPGNIRHRRRHRRLYLKGDVPKWLKPYLWGPNGHLEKYGCAFAWYCLQWEAERRLKSWNEGKACREERKNNTCEKCGVYEIDRRGFFGVKVRWDCVLPNTKMFGKRPPRISGHERDAMSRAELASKLVEINAWWEEHKAPRLCVPCWNKERWIYQKARETAELQTLINKTQREIRNGSKEHHKQHPAIPH